MIYTVTLNPAIDYIVRSDDHPIPGAINRLQSERIRIGGKGINVSRVLAALGHPSVALGFVAGLTGEAIRAGLHTEGLATDFILLSEGHSRINVKLTLNAPESKETELNGQGPTVSLPQLDALCDRIARLADGDTLILAGSIPPSLPPDTYARLLRRTAGKSVRVVVDTTGEALRYTLPFHPFLIKPNRDELGELFGVDIPTAEAAVPYARRLQEAGARNVLVTLGAEGACLLDRQGHIYQAPAHDGIVKSAVGAGDATVAGFIAGCEVSPTPEKLADLPDMAYALRLAMAAGGAVAFADKDVTKEAIEALMSR